MVLSGEVETNRRFHVIGILLLLAAASLWSLNGALIKLIDDQGRGPNALVIAFYRSLFAGLLLIPLARGRLHTLQSTRGTGQSAGAPRTDRRAPPSGLRSLAAVANAILTLRPAALSCVVFFTLMTAAFILANVKTEAANAIILQYTAPPS